MVTTTIYPAAAIILATGGSLRMGRPTQLLRFRGKPLIRHAAESAVLAGCDPVVVVVGSAEAQVRPVLSGLPLSIARNPEWEEGMGTSIRTGLRAIGHAPVCGAVLALADQPFVDDFIIHGLVEQHRLSGQAIVAAHDAGTSGVPAFFAESVFPWLLALGPNESCRGLIPGNRLRTPMAESPDYSHLAFI